jgi:hypothetical protein
MMWTTVIRLRIGTRGLFLRIRVAYKAENVLLAELLVASQEESYAMETDKPAVYLQNEELRV